MLVKVAVFTAVLLAVAALGISQESKRIEKAQGYYLENSRGELVGGLVLAGDDPLLYLDKGGYKITMSVDPSATISLSRGDRGGQEIMLMIDPVGGVTLSLFNPSTGRLGLNTGYQGRGPFGFTDSNGITRYLLTQ